ncbi:hypothetical protein ACEQ8H_003879 [Pleosporales sp. CAS-2024a]
MPLQKLVQGRPPTDSQMTKRRQLQERRRTLQTISELTTADYVANPRAFPGHDQKVLACDFGVPTMARQTLLDSKRQSHPQYYARPERVDARSPLASAQMAAMRVPLAGGDPVLRSQPEAGWNARRERTRMQAELALSGTKILRQEWSNSNLQSESSSDQTNTSLQSRSQTGKPSLDSYYSPLPFQPISRSLTSPPSQSQLLSGGGPISRHSECREHDIDLSEQASMDSSSFRSSRDSTMRRSRSSSSSQSFTMAGAPPLPTGCAPMMLPYYTTPMTNYPNGYPLQLPGPMYSPQPSEMRTWSLPYMREDHPSAPLLHHASSMSSASSAARRYNNSLHACPKTRPKSLAARAASSEQQRQRTRHAPRSSTTPQPARYNAHRRSRTSLASRASSAPHGQYASSLKSGPSSHLPRRTDMVTFSQDAAVPKRESLTKWKSEREEAKAEFDFMQRAKMKERVRRANEMEQEKEKELQALGLGVEKGVSSVAKRPGGCFGAFWSRLVGVRGSK